MTDKKEKGIRFIIFCKTLRETYNLSHEQFKKHYCYSGGNGYYGKDASPTYKEQKRKEREYAISCGISEEWILNHHSSTCLCLTYIKNNIYFKHKTTGHIIIIGNRCRERYLNKNKKCGICTNTHQNRKDNFCNECRKTKKNEIKIINEKKQELIKQKETAEKDKQRFYELKNYEVIPWEDIKENNYYIYSRIDNKTKERKIVRIKCLEYSSSFIECKGNGYDAEWTLYRNKDFVFYAKIN